MVGSNVACGDSAGKSTRVEAAFSGNVVAMSNGLQSTVGASACSQSVSAGGMKGVAECNAQ